MRLNLCFLAYVGDGLISLAYFTDHSHNMRIYNYCINLVVLYIEL